MKRERKIEHPWELVLSAAEYAAQAHRGQTRKGSSQRPYVEHCIGVANILASHGVDDPVTLAAALLHDTIEDCHKTRDELAAKFGDAVADVVVEVTDDKTLEKTARKESQVLHAPRLSARARLVKLADKIVNVREVAVDPPHWWEVERRLDYVRWAQRVVAAIPAPYPKAEGPLRDLFDAQCRATLDCIAAEIKAASLI
jgi:guanosine-3',5'-bis(diphosphate) 3'-pyrophosphohydrolase